MGSGGGQDALVPTPTPQEAYATARSRLQKTATGQGVSFQVLRRLGDDRLGAVVSGLRPTCRGVSRATDSNKVVKARARGLSWSQNKVEASSTTLW